MDTARTLLVRASSTPAYWGRAARPFLERLGPANRSPRAHTLITSWMPTSWVMDGPRAWGKSWDGSQASALAVGAERWDDIAHCTHEDIDHKYSCQFLLVSLSNYLDNDRSVLRSLFTPQEDQEPFFFCRGAKKLLTILQDKINDTPWRHALWSEKLMRCLSSINQTK